MNYRQIYQAQTISRRGSCNSYLQMKPEIKINYKSAHTNAGTLPGDGRGENETFRRWPLPRRQPPKLLKCSFHNGSGFVKERNAQVNVSFIPCLTKIKLEREEMPMSTVFRALLRGQEWFRYSSFYFSCWGRA